MTDEERHELSEAEALAQALERDAASPDLPADALQTAAFLRFSGPDANLGEAAEQRILAELQGAMVRAPSPQTKRSSRVWIWLAPVLALGALSFLFVSQQASSPESSPSAPRVTSAASHAVPSQQSLTASEQEVLCDLAELQLKQGQTEVALRTIADGLVLSAIPTETLARLYVIKAQAHERRNETLLANDSYYQALKINQQLLQKSLGE